MSEVKRFIHEVTYEGGEMTEVDSLPDLCGSELYTLASDYDALKVERDAALAREAESCRSYDSLVDRSNRRGEANEAREAALREELARLKVAAANVIVEGDALQQRLTVAEQRAGEMANALARIQGRAEMFIDDGMHMPTPSIEAIRDIAAKAALKQAAEGEGS